MFIGSQHVESPYVEIGAAATAFYFSWFVFIVPVIGVVENTLMDVALSEEVTSTSPSLNFSLTPFKISI